MANSSILGNYHKKYPSLEQIDFAEIFGLKTDQPSSGSHSTWNKKSCVASGSRYFKRCSPKTMSPIIHYYLEINF